MSDYLNEADTDDDEPQIVAAKETASMSADEGKLSSDSLKSEGNALFSEGKFNEALVKYTEALNVLKLAGLSKDPLILLNRSATYLGLKRYVPALNDANQAAEIDPSNWKAHWRKGVALMSMTKKKFRTQQAIESFQSCITCGTLPENKIKEVENELKKAKARYEQQEAETPPADLSNCAPS